MYARDGFWLEGRAQQVVGGNTTTRAHTERSWRDCMRHPSQWRDKRKSKRTPRPPHLHLHDRPTKESLWMHGCYNPSLFQDMPAEPASMISKSHQESHQHNHHTYHSNNCGHSSAWKVLSLEEALPALEKGMLPFPSMEDLACILHRCRKERNLAHAVCLHAYMRERGLEDHSSLGNYLVLMLVEVGSMCHAQQVFDRLAYQDECLWNSLITGYVKCGEPKHALILYQKMQEDGSVHPSGYTFVPLLKACTMLKDVERGCEMHADIARKGLLETDIFVGSTLVDMYAKCGSFAKAHEVFDKLPVRNVVSWTALMAGYAEHGYGEEALDCFEHMQQEGISPSAVTFFCILKACGSIGAIDKGTEIHADLARKGMEKDPIVGSSLIDMYAKCGSLATAHEVFDKLPVRDVVLWNALIAGYAAYGCVVEALDCFKRMQHENISPDIVTFVCILKACGKIGAIYKGQEIHVDIARKGLERDIFVGSTLVDMYAKGTALAEAQEVFDKLPVRVVVSWNALIAGYTEHECYEEALVCFNQMRHEGVPPDAITLVFILKACGATDKGQEMHAEIARKGFERELLVGNTLVDMYAKCGLLAEAQVVFDKLSARTVVSWNALIAGYAEHERGEEALNCFKHMQHEGICPGVVSFVCSLKACGSIGAIDKGCAIHAEISKIGLLERDIFVGSSLVDMYAKCGSLVEAQFVFDRLASRDVVSWTALIAGYAEHGDGEEAVNCFYQMQHEGISPVAATFVCSLKACACTEATVKGREVHADIARKGLERDLVVGSTLVNMYAKCGLLAEAHNAFIMLPFLDMVSWTALIAGYVEHGCGEEALHFLEQMQYEGVSQGVVTFVCSLKACGSLGSTLKGREIHVEIARNGLERDLFVGSTLVNMYAKCGLLVEAREVFDKLTVQNVVSFNALIAGYVAHGRGEEALHYLEQMQHEGISPDAATFDCSLKACGSIGAIVKGHKLHAEIVKKGLLERDIFAGSTLVDMYARFGSLAEAQEVFDKLPVRDVVSWVALTAGYAEHGCGEEALNCFEQMQHEGVSPVTVTFVCSLKACGSIGAIDKGREIHVEVAKKGLEKELLVGNTLVDMYARFALLEDAKEAFDKLQVQDVFSWTALMAGYAEYGCGEEALDCFEQMEHEGIPPGLVTFVCSLKACASIGSKHMGCKVHAEIARKGLERDLFVGSTLVDMYAKCGLLVEAQEVFDTLPIQDVVSCTALIAGYAQLGECENVFHILDRMKGGGVEPNLVTCVNVLNACSHAGLVDKGEMYFKAISNDCGFIPTLEHYTCMVDLLGRAGQIDEVAAIFKKMPFHLGSVVWHTVLGACQKWGNVELGRHAFEHAVQLDENDIAAYVCMSNIYTDAAMQEGNKVKAILHGKQG